MLQRAGIAPLNSNRVVVVCYAVMGIVLAGLFSRLSSNIEAALSGQPVIGRRFGLHKSRKVVFRLSALFSLDAFAGGFVITSFVAYWFHIKFGVEPALWVPFSSLPTSWQAFRRFPPRV